MIRKFKSAARARWAGVALRRTAAFAQEAAKRRRKRRHRLPQRQWPQAATTPIKAPTVEQMAGMVNKGDTAWMLISSALVLTDVDPGAGAVLRRPSSAPRTCSAC
jgi:hypothetical protein